MFPIFGLSEFLFVTHKLGSSNTLNMSACERLCASLCMWFCDCAFFTRFVQRYTSEHCIHSRSILLSMPFAQFKQNIFLSHTFLRCFSRSFVRSLLLPSSSLVDVHFFSLFNFLFISLTRRHTLARLGQHTYTLCLSLSHHRFVRNGTHLVDSLRLKLYSTQFSLTLQFCHPFRRYRFWCFHFHCSPFFFFILSLFSRVLKLTKKAHRL